MSNYTLYPTINFILNTPRTIQSMAEADKFALILIFLPFYCLYFIGALIIAWGLMKVVYRTLDAIRIFLIEDVLGLVEWLD